MDEYKIADQIPPGAWKGLRERREVVREQPLGRMCFCFTDEGILYGCDLVKEGEQCLWRKNEVTDLFDIWLDGDIYKGKLCKMILDRMKERGVVK